ncbi:hypothetical protein EH243_02080 [Amphritea opalescens]|uniref:YbjN domain-containing protein n=1 Tax=Amphritea opalescens TaxID=2490544 RepID=A0A430KW88_9GAMM|nr:hypothetical protein [Amphritea opalescens]RTE67759.1 hypothetical protein EH243_02080 [Amphritea opalescens]
MATSFKQLEALLDDIGWKYKSNPNDSGGGYIYSGFPTKVYKDKDGDHYATVLFSVQENGELIKFIVPKLYNCVDRNNRKAFFEVAIRKSFEKKLCFYDYDHRDGEIRMIVDFPLEDASLTKQQVIRVVKALITLIDTNDQDVRAAVEEGRLPLLDYKSDLSHEISKMNSDQQLELLVEIKRRNQGIK